MTNGPTDGNLDALDRHLAAQEAEEVQQPDDWEDEERAEQVARHKLSDRGDW